MIEFDNFKFDELAYKLVDPTFRELYAQNLILKIFWIYGLDESIGNDAEKVSKEIYNIVQKRNIKKLRRHEKQYVKSFSYEQILKSVKESFELSIYANN